MKKVKSAVALLLAAVCVVLFTQPAIGVSDDNRTTRRLNYVPVYVLTPHQHLENAIVITDVYTQDDVDYYNYEMDHNYVTAQNPYTHRIGDASLQYNCHSYAWIYQSTNNPVWYEIPKNSDFFNCANSYIPISGSITIGDILLYVEDIGDDDYEIKHSAVVVSTDGTASNTILVSKWGTYGLYEHKIFTGHPYTSYGIFYYHVSSTHNLSYTDTGSAVAHVVSCSCGKTFSDPHNYQSAYGGTAYICSNCGHLQYIRSANSIIREEQ